MNPIFLTIILIPVIEIYLLIKIGSQIGAITTILLIFTTAIVGILLGHFIAQKSISEHTWVLSHGEKWSTPLSVLCAALPVASVLFAFVNHVDPIKVSHEQQLSPYSSSALIKLAQRCSGIPLQELSPLNVEVIEALPTPQACTKETRLLIQQSLQRLSGFYPKLSEESNLVSHKNTIIGNTVLYGATSGKLFAAGQAGERFAVRNSGALSVIEGCDSNACEYMTGGTVVVLGEVGDNFGAGMTGGMAFVYDPDYVFEKKANPESIVWQSLETDYWISYLKEMVQEHFNETNSNLSKKIIENFDNEILNFIQVCPKEMLDKLKNPITLKSIVKKVS